MQKFAAFVVAFLVSGQAYAGQIGAIVEMVFPPGCKVMIKPDYMEVTLPDSNRVRLFVSKHGGMVLEGKKLEAHLSESTGKGSVSFFSPNAQGAFTVPYKFWVANGDVKLVDNFVVPTAFDINNKAIRRVKVYIATSEEAVKKLAGK